MRPIFDFLRKPFAIFCLVLTACATEPVGRKDLLTFLNDGVSRREEVFLKLGEPSAQYEGSRILAYRLRKDAGGHILVGRRDNWAGVHYNLMLVFDADGVLIRHSVVEVRSP
ncbi:MAG: hypothetical protein Q8K18_12550 [Burkholderiales bacterium]|nr:hypothetical protein [Burkholderiales bacterium]